MTRREPRWWFVVYAVALGALVAGASMAGDQPVMAVFAVPIMAVFGLAMAMTPWGSLRTSSRDERESKIGREAVEYSAYAMTTVALAGWLWSIARGEPSPEFTLMAAVGGFSYLVALAVLSRRR